MEGNFGLEKESLRVTSKGNMAHTPHPFEDPHLVRDFCENQTEINTDAYDSVQEALNAMKDLTAQIQIKLAEMGEYLWPFSNPSLIVNEEDIPVAHYETGSDPQTYREYLSMKYGRYRMTLSGIHYNFSFSDALLKAAFEDSGSEDFQEFKNSLYLNMAWKIASKGWLINALICASPVVDGSFFEKSLIQNTYFTGVGSVRCSERGYWNFFVPIFDYSSLEAYIHSIEDYCHQGLIVQPRELYYPIRLKPPGKNTLDNLRQNGVSHIELRSIDLNPFVFEGMHLKDAQFLHYFLVWLACLPDQEPTDVEQMMAVQNFKNAAHYDLKANKIVYGNENSETVFDAAEKMLAQIHAFYETIDPKALGAIEFQQAKLNNPRKKRYAWKVRNQYGTNYVNKGLKLAAKRQQEALHMKQEG